MKNGVFMQGFHWYIKPEEKLWNLLRERSHEICNAGFSAIWLPPAYKAMGGKNDTGYGVYDMYDLGEFNQKGSIETKYGTKDEYLACIDAFHLCSMDVYGDIVLNHRMGADGKEKVFAKEVNRNNTTETISEDEEIEVDTIFNFPGRHGKYSSYTWNWQNFDGVDYDEKTHRNTIFLFDSKSWDNQVDDEHQNYDYLMGADLDFSYEGTINEVKNWIKWYVDFTHIDGLRLDAIKHIPAYFYKDYMKMIREYTKKEMFTVGEYWHGDVQHLNHYLDEVNYCMSLFDVPLHYHLFDASQNEDYDMSKIFDSTLVQSHPTEAVTFVDNHDSEPTQALASFITTWFKGQAYALILLRQGGYPCVFYGDYYGIEYEDVPAQKEMIDTMISLRKKHNYGKQVNYFDDPHLIGWIQCGDEKHQPMCVVLTNNYGGIKKMHIGQQFANQIFYNVFNKCQQTIIDENGDGEFYCENKNFAVYIMQ